MKLRPYQLDILDAVRKGWGEFDRQLVVSPTGSGKTVCFSHMAGEFVAQGQRVLILVDQDELVWQAIDKLEKTTGIRGQAEKAEHHADKNAMVVVATIQSLCRRLHQWDKDHFGLVIADEADKSISDSWQSVLNHFTAKVCGFTATPHRTDRRNLGCFYQNVAAEVGLFDLIRQGYLSPICVKMMPIQIDLSGVGIDKGDFDKNDLDSVIGPHLVQVANAIADHAAFRKTMVFLPLIKTSEKFVAICNDIGLRAEHIDGKSEDRAEKLKRFANWEFDVIANSALLTRGYDDPSIDCVVMLRPTKSVTLYTQCIGRGTRICEGKENLLLLDFLFASSKHRLSRPANLIAANDTEADSITTLTEQKAGLPSDIAEQMDLTTLASEASSVREEALRRKLEEQSKKKAKFISADEFALNHHAMSAVEYEPTMEWERQAPTDKQLGYIKKAGIDPASVRGRVHASKLLDLYFRNQGLRMATPAVVSKIRQMPWIAEQVGITDFVNITTQQAGRFFAALKAGPRGRVKGAA